MLGTLPLTEGSSSAITEESVMCPVVPMSTYPFCGDRLHALSSSQGPKASGQHCGRKRAPDGCRASRGWGSKTWLSRGTEDLRKTARGSGPRSREPGPSASMAPKSPSTLTWAGVRLGYGPAPPVHPQVRKQWQLLRTKLQRSSLHRPQPAQQGEKVPPFPQEAVLCTGHVAKAGRRESRCGTTPCFARILADRRS